MCGGVVSSCLMTVNIQEEARCQHLQHISTPQLNAFQAQISPCLSSIALDLVSFILPVIEAECSVAPSMGQALLYTFP